MDSATPVVLRLEVPEYNKVIIETSERKKYYSDLSDLSSVYCYPKTNEEWKQVAADSYGFALVWSCRFEVHVDQIIGLAYKVEDLAESA